MSEIRAFSLWMIASVTISTDNDLTTKNTNNPVDPDGSAANNAKATLFKPMPAGSNSRPGTNKVHERSSAAKEPPLLVF